MKRYRRWIPILVLALQVVPAFGQKVFIDYDKNYDNEGIETFAWMKTEDTSLKEDVPHLHEHIVSAIQYYLTRDGAKEVTENPDVYVTYHASSKTDVSVSTRLYGYAYPIGWMPGGYYGMYGYSAVGIGVGVVSNTAVYQRGTLVVDVWDANSKELIWRGMATKIDVTQEARTMYKRINKALEKMVKEWHKIEKKIQKDRQNARADAEPEE